MSFISSLNLLHSDSPLVVTEDTFSDELALWANAQFTFDITPGTALVDECGPETHNEQSKQEDVFKLLDHYKAMETSAYASSFQVLPSAPPTEHSPLPRLAPTMTLPSADSSKTEVSVGPMKKRKTGGEKELPVSLEDDKRRRNTAASARFRQKKKIREHALEQTAKEMTDKTEALEKRVKELEMEAKWLRALIVEKDMKLSTPTPVTL
ncbi:hypothetical protein BDF14DRAFT_1847649 [Spinellus fusiger]|nr:hypothetical protein BDF14DRAFT_1847649 [Spinellus fusiger]